MGDDSPDILTLPPARRSGRSRRPWPLRWIRRTALLTVLLLAGYVALPWWFPVGWLHGRIVRQLQEDFDHRPVSIGAIEVSWADGVVVRDLRIAQADDFASLCPRSSGDLIRVEEVCCPLGPLAPLRMLWAGRIDWLRVKGPHVWIVRDAGGRLNCEWPAGRGFSLRADRVTFEDVTVSLLDLKNDRPADIRVGFLEFQADPRAGGIRTAAAGWFAYQPTHGEGKRFPVPKDRDGGDQTLGRFHTNISMLDPTTGFAGQAGWETVNLSDILTLGAGTTQRWGMRGVGGRCGGTLGLRISPHGRIDWTVSASVQDAWLALARWPGRLAAPAARVELAGHYDAPTRHNSVERLRVQLPGLDMQAKADLRPDGGYLGLHIRQALIRPAELAQAAPELAALIQRTWKLDGELAVQGLVEWSDSSSGADLTVDATGLAARAEGLLDKPAGLRAVARVKARYDRDVDRLYVEQLETELGGSRLTLEAVADDLFPVLTARRKVWDVWLDWRGKLEFETADSQELLSRAPALGRALERATVAGPVSGRLSFEPISQGPPWARRVTGRLLTALAHLDRGSRMIWPAPDGRELVRKTGPEPVSLSLLCRFAPDSLTIESGSLVLRRGEQGAAQTAELGLAPFTGKLAFYYPDSVQAGSPWPHDPPGRARPEMDAVLDGTIVARALERLIELSPRLDDALRQRQIKLAGGLDGEVNLRLGPSRMRVRLALELERLGAQIESPIPVYRDWGPLAETGLTRALTRPAGMDLGSLALHKQAGEPASFEFNYTGYPQADASPFADGEVRWAGLGLTLSAGRTVAPGRDLRAIRFQVQDAETLLAHVPALAERLAPWQPAGALSGSATWAPGGQHEYDVRLDATALAFRTGRPDGGTKAAGVPLVLAARLRTDAPNAPALPHIRLTDVRLQAGRSELAVRGTIDLLAVGWDSIRPPPIDRLNVALAATLTLDEQLRALAPSLAAMLQPYGLRGRVDVFAHLMGGWNELELLARIDATELSANWPNRLVKPAAVGATCELDLLTTPTLNLWTCRQATVRIADAGVRATGQLFRPSTPDAPVTYDFSADLWLPDLGQVERLAPILLSNPPLLAGPLAGRIDGRFRFFCDGADDPAAAGPWRDARIRLLPGHLEFCGVRGTLAGLPLSADGRIELSDRELFIPRLAMQLGDSRAAVVARLSDPAGRPTGWLDLAGELLDIDQLGAVWSRLRTMPLPTLGPGPPTPPGIDLQDRLARKIVDFVAGGDLRGKAHFADVFVTDSKNQVRRKLSEFQGEFAVDGGRVLAPFATAMDGGVLTGRVSCNLRDPAPMLLTEYEAYRLLPTKAVQPMIEAFFPGMTIHGYVTMSERSRQKLLPEPGEPNWPVGHGEVIFENGVLVGQAGPDWMVKVFPGLKLTHYRFNRMHDWLELADDGRANHHMIFNGSMYDLYMTGYTHRGTGQAGYTVGVDLLAGFESKTWSVDLKQGKIPLMDISGRIENRQLKDASFQWVIPPVAIYDVLIRDSLVYRAFRRAMNAWSPAEDADQDSAAGPPKR